PNASVNRINPTAYQCLARFRPRLVTPIVTGYTTMLGRYVISRQRCGGNRAFRQGAAAAGPDTGAVPAAELQHQDRACLRELGAPIHPCQRPAPSTRHGRGGGGGVFVHAGDAGRRGGQHAEPGAVGVAVSVPGGTWYGAAVDGVGGACQAPAEGAGGAFARRGGAVVGDARWAALADGGAALWRRHPVDGVRAAAGAGRRFRPPRDPGAERKGREGSPCAVAAASARTAPGAGRPCRV